MNDYQAGQQLLGGGYSSYTPTGKGYLSKKGRISKTPHRGDIVYFYTSSKGRVSHVGIVETVELSNGLYSITTLEGNTSAGANNTVVRDGGKYARKYYDFLPSQVGAPNRIDCFCTPLFSAETCSVEQFVQAAIDQLGYLEKKSEGTDEQLLDKEWNPGVNNITWYGRWYGMQAEWCQMSVSYIAYLACKRARNHQTGWEERDGFWYYWKQDGTQATAEWQYIGGRWYVFDEMGRMIKGWFKSSVADWYYLGEDGGMLSEQWIWDENKSYYLTKSGLMAKNAYVRSDKPYGPGAYIYYWVNNKGEWEPQWDTEKPDLKKYDLAE